MSKYIDQERRSVLGLVYFETKMVGGTIADDILDQDEEISATGKTPQESYLAMNRKLSTYIDDLTAARAEIAEALKSGNPWLDAAGCLKDNPVWPEIARQIAEDRHKELPE